MAVVGALITGAVIILVLICCCLTAICSIGSLSAIFALPFVLGKMVLGGFVMLVLVWLLLASQR